MMYFHTRTTTVAPSTSRRTQNLQTHPPCPPLAAGTTPRPSHCSPDVRAPGNVNAQSTSFEVTPGHFLSA
eukprot:4893886-Prymnesium_polylepis.1